MEYIIIEDNKYAKEISNGLISFNDSMIGQREYIEHRVILLKDNEIIGGSLTASIWDIINIAKIWVKDSANFNILLNKIYDLHKDEANKMLCVYY